MSSWYFFSSLAARKKLGTDRNFRSIIFAGYSLKSRPQSIKKTEIPLRVEEPYISQCSNDSLLFFSVEFDQISFQSSVETAITLTFKKIVLIKLSLKRIFDD
jgi:hypothetical protein